VKCYQLNEQGILLQGISVMHPRGQTFARMHMPPPEVPMYNPTAFEYVTDLKFPQLDSELTKRLALNQVDDEFLIPDIRLSRCDLDKRSQFWALPETTETSNCALVLALAIDQQMGQIPDHDFQIVGEGSEILAESAISRHHPRCGYKGLVALVKLAPGSILRVRRQLRGRRVFGMQPLVSISLQCLTDGSVAHYGGNASHPKLPSEPKPSFRLMPFR
jgi:hypothetical protein